MRFSTVYMFMLPLSTLAVPSLVRRQSPLASASKEAGDGLSGARGGSNTTLSRARAMKPPPQQAVIDDATKAQGDIALADAAVGKIGAAITAGVAPQEAE